MPTQGLGPAFNHRGLVSKLWGGSFFRPMSPLPRIMLPPRAGHRARLEWAAQAMNVTTGDIDGYEALQRTAIV